MYENEVRAKKLEWGLWYQKNDKRMNEEDSMKKTQWRRLNELRDWLTNQVELNDEWNVTQI